jgi:hypothetical protein
VARARSSYTVYLQVQNLTNQTTCSGTSKIKDALGPTIVSLVERLSSSEVTKCLGIAAFGILSSVPWEVFLFSEGPLSKVPL